MKFSRESQGNSPISKELSGKSFFKELPLGLQPNFSLIFAVFDISSTFKVAIEFGVQDLNE